MTSVAWVSPKRFSWRQGGRGEWVDARALPGFAVAALCAILWGGFLIGLRAEPAATPRPTGEVAIAGSPRTP